MVSVGVYLVWCLSYDDLQEIKGFQSLSDAQENFEELIEYLEEPCENPKLYAHVMQTAHQIAEDNNLKLHTPYSYKQYQQFLFRNCTSIDLSEVKNW